MKRQGKITLEDATQMEKMFLHLYAHAITKFLNGRQIIAEGMF